MKIHYERFIINIIVMFQNTKFIYLSTNIYIKSENTKTINFYMNTKNFYNINFDMMEDTNKLFYYLYTRSNSHQLILNKPEIKHESILQNRDIEFFKKYNLLKDLNFDLLKKILLCYQPVKLNIYIHCSIENSKLKQKSYSFDISISTRKYKSIEEFLKSEKILEEFLKTRSRVNQPINKKEDIIVIDNSDSDSDTEIDTETDDDFISIDKDDEPSEDIDEIKCLLEELKNQKEISDFTNDIFLSMLIN